MFCSKCGTQNPENGKFCRSCGNVIDPTAALAVNSQPPVLADRKGRSITWEGAITKFAMGLAFLVIAIALGLTNMAGGGSWWFWLLIPAFTMIGTGIAQYIQLKQTVRPQQVTSPEQPILSAPAPAALSPQPAEFLAVESRYKTGDLVPPSVTDTTTRKLELDNEGQTMTLPKR